MNGNISCWFPIRDGKYGAITGPNFTLVLPPEYDYLSGPTKIEGFTVFNTRAKSAAGKKIRRYVGRNGVRFYAD